MAEARQTTHLSSLASADAVAWFAVLENARQRADFDRAAQARRELKRLGVAVKYLLVEQNGAQDAR